MEIIRNGSQPSANGPADYFTGKVRIDSPFEGIGGANVSGAIVTFEPGRAQCLAHASAGTGPDRHRRQGLDAVRRRPDRGDQPRRHHRLSIGSPALAWRHADHGDDPRRRAGSEERQGGRVDG